MNATPLRITPPLRRARPRRPAPLVIPPPDGRRPFVAARALETAPRPAGYPPFDAARALETASRRGRGSRARTGRGYPYTPRGTPRGGLLTAPKARAPLVTTPPHCGGGLGTSPEAGAT